MFNTLQDAIELGEQGKKRDNDGGVPIFELRAVPKENKRSKEVEYEDVVWVTIFNKGDPKNIIERPMRDTDIERWPEHWEAYKKNEEPPINGIPLEDFPHITPAERQRCKQKHLRTVEDLADFPDGQIEELGGRGFALQKAAREYIAYREGVQVSDLQDEIKELKDQIATLTKELNSGNSTGNNSGRSSGNKSAKTKRGNKRRAGSGGKSVSASEDDGEETR